MHNIVSGTVFSRYWRCEGAPYYILDTHNAQLLYKELLPYRIHVGKSTRSSMYWNIVPLARYHMDIQLYSCFAIFPAFCIISTPFLALYLISHSCYNFSLSLQLSAEISDIFSKHSGRYGVRRVHQELLNRGYQVNHKKIQRIMHQMKLSLTIFR